MLREKFIRSLKEWFDTGPEDNKEESDMQIATLKEVSLFLKVKESTLYSWAETGRIPASKLNGLWRFDMEEIREWFRKSVKRPVKAIMPLKKTVKRGDIDAIIKKAIDDVNGKGYNPSIGKPGPNQGPQKRGSDEGIV